MGEHFSVSGVSAIFPRSRALMLSFFRLAKGIFFFFLHSPLPPPVEPYAVCVQLPGARPANDGHVVTI